MAANGLVHWTEHRGEDPHISSGVERANIGTHSIIWHGVWSVLR